jgi:RNA polymerase sigma-70 factor (ECF subfamily)
MNNSTLTKTETMGVLAISAKTPADAHVAELAATVASAQSGDVGAYERLYHQHVGRIYAICLRMTANPDRAEEATQQAFINAWRRLETFNGDHFAAWLKKIAVNAVLSEARSRGRRREDAMDDVEQAAADEAPRPVAVPDHGLDLESAIKILPERARTVFVLHDVEGYRHREIAEMIGVAEGTSKAQLHRARKTLREVLQR